MFRYRDGEETEIKSLFFLAITYFCLCQGIFHSFSLNTFKSSCTVLEQFLQLLLQFDQYMQWPTSFLKGNPTVVLLGLDVNAVRLRKIAQGVFHTFTGLAFEDSLLFGRIRSGNKNARFFLIHELHKRMRSFMTGKCYPPFKICQLARKRKKKNQNEFNLPPFTCSGLRVRVSQLVVN